MPFPVVVPSDVGPHAEDPVRYRSVVANTLATVGRLVLPDLAFHIVRREQGVPPGSGFRRADRIVNAPAALILAAKQRMPLERARIRAVLVGHQYERQGVPEPGFACQLIQEFRERAIDRRGLEAVQRFEAVPVLLLGCRHSSRSAKRRMREAQGKERGSGCCNRVIVWIVLTCVEALQAVDADVFMDASGETQAAVERYHLPAQAIEAIHDGSARGGQEPTQPSNTDGFSVRALKVTVVDTLLGIIVEPKGLRRERGPAQPAFEAADCSEGPGRIDASRAPPAIAAGEQVVAADGVGTERRLRSQIGVRDSSEHARLTPPRPSAPAPGTSFVTVKWVALNRSHS